MNNIQTITIATLDKHTKAPEKHPACNLFPPLESNLFETLINDIRTNGLCNPIVLLDAPGDPHHGTILDGANRFQACKSAEVPPEFIFKKTNNPLKYAISANISRRQLDSSQRAILALRLLPELKKYAEIRMKSGQRNPSSNLSEGPGKATSQASKQFGISTTYVETAAKIQRNGIPELLDLVLYKELSLDIAHKIALSYSKEEQQKLVNKGVKVLKKRALEGPPKKKRKKMTGRRRGVEVTIFKIDDLIKSRLKRLKKDLKKASKEDLETLEVRLAALQNALDEARTHLN